MPSTTEPSTSYSIDFNEDRCSRAAFISVVKSPQDHIYSKDQLLKGQVSLQDFNNISREAASITDEQLRKAFELLDVNHDGTVSYAELKEGLLKRNNSLSETELNKMFQAADINQDGLIHYNEFIELVQKTNAVTLATIMRRLERAERKETIEARQKSEDTEEASDTMNLQKRRPKLISRKNRSRSGSQSSISSVLSTGAPESRMAAISESLESNPNESPVPEVVKRRDSQMSSQSKSVLNGEKTRITTGANGVVDDMLVVKPALTALTKRIPEPRNLEVMNCTQRQGCFFYDHENNSDVLVAQIYSFTLHDAANLWITIKPLPTDPAAEEPATDVTLFVIDSSGTIVAFTEHCTPLGSFCLRCDLDEGTYKLVPFTTGCWFRPRHSVTKGKSRANLVEQDRTGNLKLTKQFRMSLLTIFELFDLDKNGSLSREEFDLYNVRTGDEHVTDEEWNVIKETFNTRNGEVTLKGFLQLHQLEAEDQNEDNIEDMWLSLNAVGFNQSLIMDEACPFLLSIHSDSEPENQPSIAVVGFESIPGAYDEAMLKFLSAKSQEYFVLRNFCVSLYQTDCFVAVIGENSGDDIAKKAVKFVGPQNLKISTSSEQLQCSLGRLSSRVLCYVLPKDRNETWSFKLTIEDA